MYGKALHVHNSTPFFLFITWQIREWGGMFDTLYKWFWWDKIWLPAELSWADLEDKEGRIYAKASDLYVTVPYAFGFLLIRYLFERYNRMSAHTLAAFPRFAKKLLALKSFLTNLGNAAISISVFILGCCIISALSRYCPVHFVIMFDSQG